MNSVFLVHPKEVEDHKIDVICDTLTNYKCKISTVQSYNLDRTNYQFSFNDSQFVVLVLPNFRFKHKLIELDTCLLDLFDMAMVTNKDIILAYDTLETPGIPRFYKTKIDTKYITGLASTSKEVQELFTNNLITLESKEKIDLNSLTNVHNELPLSTYIVDKRVLLLIN